jgi:hypothetical protein
MHAVLDDDSFQRLFGDSKSAVAALEASLRTANIDDAGIVLKFADDCVGGDLEDGSHFGRGQKRWDYGIRVRLRRHVPGNTTRQPALTRRQLRVILDIPQSAAARLTITGGDSDHDFHHAPSGEGSARRD